MTSKHGTTPGGTKLLMMVTPPAGTKRDLISAAAQQTFDNARIQIMTEQDKAASTMSNAIAAQVASRTPDPRQQHNADLRTSEEPTRGEMNRLTKQQRYALQQWLSSDMMRGLIIGKTLVHVANMFNDTIASVHPAFADGTRVNGWNVRSLIVELGYGTLSHAIVAVKAAVLRPLAEPAKAPAPLPAGVEAVTMYRGDDGQLYASLAEATNASFVTNLAQYIYESQDGHDEGSAKSLARALLRRYNISLK